MSDVYLVYTDNYAVEFWGPKNRGLVLKVNYWINLQLFSRNQFEILTLESSNLVHNKFQNFDKQVISYYLQNYTLAIKFIEILALKIINSNVTNKLILLTNRGGFYLKSVNFVME